MVRLRQDAPETVGQKNLHRQACSAVSRALNDICQGMVVMMKVMMILTRNMAL